MYNYFKEKFIENNNEHKKNIKNFKNCFTNTPSKNLVHYLIKCEAI